MAPGAEESLAPPCSKLRSFGANVLYWRKYLWYCWEFLAPPVAIRRPGNCAPLVTPLSLTQAFLLLVYERSSFKQFYSIWHFKKLQLYCVAKDTQKDTASNDILRRLTSMLLITVNLSSWIGEVITEAGNLSNIIQRNNSNREEATNGKVVRQYNKIPSH